MREHARLAAIGLMLVAIAGCAGGGGGKKTIVFWQFWPMEVVTPIVERFEQEHPEYDVVVEQLTWQAGQEKIAAAVASGQVPDLVELGSTWFPAFAYKGALVEWTDSVATWRDQYRLWEMCEVNSQVFGLPWLGGTRALFYNKALMAQAGVDSSRAPETWEELYAACHRIHLLGNGVAGYGANAGERYVLFKKFMPYAWSNGGKILSADNSRCEFNSPQNRDALDFYLALASVGRVEQQSQIDQAFKEGKIGATLSGGWLVDQIERDAPDLRYGVALVPMPSTGQHRSFAGGEILSTFKKSKQKKGAYELARFLVQPENALAIARAKKSVHPTAIAAKDDAYFAEHPKEQVFLDQLALAVPTPNHPEWGRMESAIETAVEEALLKRKTSSDAIAQAAREIESVLGTKTARR